MCVVCCVLCVSATLEIFNDDSKYAYTRTREHVIICGTICIHIYIYV